MRPGKTVPTGAPEPQLDEGLRALLDHIACELAQEYVRLMEAAAEEQTANRHNEGGIK